MTLALGRRFIVVDGVERWRDRDLDKLEVALGAMPPETTIAFFAREDGKAKAPARLHAAVRAAGGDVSPETNVKPWELPKWVVARGRELGVELDGDAARALVRQVGDRRQRLLRELEKLSLYVAPGERLDAGTVEELTAPSAARKAWSLADAVLAGEPAAATSLYLALRGQGERLPSLLYWMSQRIRTAHEIAVALDRGEPTAQIRRRLRMPTRAADALIAAARTSGAEKLRAALEQLADLELASRGGGAGAMGEDTAALLAIKRIA
jgi:DNA polymerase-3 subunit delta